MRKRVIVGLGLLPIGLGVIYFGDILYAVVVAIVLGIGCYEFINVFKTQNNRPAVMLAVVGAVLIPFARYFAFQQELSFFAYDSLLFGIFILLAMTYHLFAYERGWDKAGSDFTITVAGIAYFGMLGGYLLVLRYLPGGLGWVLTVLPAVWLADSGAYFFGSWLGRTPFSPRLSPKKTREGFIAGIISGALLTVLWVWATSPLLGDLTLVTLLQAGILGLILAILTPLGDLGASMFKRQFSIKDFGSIIPGHGGIFDRIDTWLWAAFIGYYVISIFFLSA